MFNYSIIKEKPAEKEKQTVTVFEGEVEDKVNLHEFSVTNRIDKNITLSDGMTDNKECASDEVLCTHINQDITDTQENNSVHHSSSVSKMALHFKTLQEKANSKDKDNLSQRTPNKGSRSIQRYRERKLQGNDRFNTQPVTFQEVQEAVLQNQRKATSIRRSSLTEGNSTATDDEFDPSKLSLAERVRLFNQKIDTEKSSVSNNMPPEKHSRRRPATRYKTQPVTSEEVEVASRIPPLNAVQYSLDNCKYYTLVKTC